MQWFTSGGVAPEALQLGKWLHGTGLYCTVYDHGLLPTPLSASVTEGAVAKTHKVQKLEEEEQRG